LILRYPDGLFGVALLLLRLSYAVITFPALARLWPAPSVTVPMGLGVAVIVLALVSGFGARAAALMLAAVLAIGIDSARGDLTWFLVGCMGGAVSLVLLGPGAWSIDAHLHGRRVIRLDPRSPERGGPG
jgi:uncharacterized membrane protein YphA (DoxX/SURF4 family)